jgi:DNA/RNA endonuclease YhcR with UshA esterase domain
MLRLASFKLVSVAALIVLLASLLGNAGTVPAPEYNKSAEVKLKGVIEDVKTAADNSIHLTLKSVTGSLDVLIAPEKFLKQMEIIFAKGEMIEVVGSPLTVDGNAIVLAREVTRNSDVVTIRDEQGKPVWVGWIK